MYNNIIIITIIGAQVAAESIARAHTQSHGRARTRAPTQLGGHRAPVARPPAGAISFRAEARRVAGHFLVDGLAANRRARPWWE